MRREPENENAGPAVCPACKGGPLDGHVAGCARLAGDLPLKPPATVKKLWKVGDRVCFAHQPLGRVYVVERVGKGEEPLIEMLGMAGIYASHLFVPAPAEPIDLPAVELEPIARPPAESGKPYYDQMFRQRGLRAAFAIAVDDAVRLRSLINTPEILDFVKAVQIEAVHQRERWGSKQDEGKTAADWFWLLGYLAGKAISADKSGDRDKVLHHIITTAAACANWHAQVLGNCNMRPGIETPAGEK